MMVEAMHKRFVFGTRYLQRLRGRHFRQSACAVALMILAGLLNGIGILLLIPMLRILGLPGSSENAPGPLFWASPVWEGLSIPWRLPVVLILFVLLSGVHAILLRWQTIVGARLQENVVCSLRNELYRAIHQASWLFFIGRRNSDFTHALTENLRRVSTGTIQGLRLISAAFITVVHVALCVAISPAMSLVTLASTLVLWPLLSRQNRAVQQTGKELTETNRSFFSNIANHLAGMKEAKSQGTQQSNIDAFEQQTEEIKNSRLLFSEAAAKTTLIYSWGAAVLLSVLLYVAYQWLHVPLVSLLVLVFVFSRVLPRLREIHSCYLQVVHMLPAFNATMDLLEECEAHREQVVPRIERPLALKQGIELRNVAFRYDRRDDDAWTLENISLAIPTRQTTAIVGPSGAGKTTLADLLLGLIAPVRGELLVDGAPLSTDRLAAWRQAIGYVPQETFLLHDSIRANLMWSNPAASAVDLREALRLAAAEEFVDGLALGLDTIVGDRGVRLSGGERQRIALARALLRKPALLVLDEATSSLDAENQRRIRDAVEALHGELTMVVVAHRLSTVRDADQIVVLDAGCVVEQGTFEELSHRSGGRFRALVEADRITDAA